MAVNAEYRFLNSGTLAEVRATGSAGTPSDVTAVATDDEVHLLTLAAVPPDYSTNLAATLGIAGGSVGFTATPAGPANYWEWTVTGLASGSYDPQINTINIGPDDPAARIDVFDGATWVGGQSFNQSNNGSGNPGGVTDGSLLNGNGQPIVRYPIGTYTCSSGTLRVRLSAHDGYYLWADNLWVFNHSGGALVQRVQPAAPPATYSALYGSPNADFNQNPDPNGVASPAANPIYMRGSGITPRYVVNAATLQAAVDTAIGSGKVTITGDGSSISPLSFRYIGPLAGQAVTLITTSLSSPSQAVATRSTGGGILPTFHLADGSTVHCLHDWLYWDRIGSPTNLIRFAFPQAPPQFTAIKCRQGMATISGPWDITGGSGSYTDQERYATGGGATATWDLGPFAPATVKVRATWKPGSDRSTAAAYTIKDFTGATLGTGTVNQTIAPSGLTRSGATWQTIAEVSYTGRNNGLRVTLSQGGGATGALVADSLLFERTSADDSVRVAQGDAVTVTAGAGWFTAAAGSAPAVTAGPVTNHAGLPSYTLPSSHSMRVGLNIGATRAGSATYRYRNIARVVEGFRDYPTVQDASTANIGITNNPPAYFGDGKGWMPVPPGRYLLAWKGRTDTGRTSLLDLYTNYTEGRITEVTGDSAATSFPVTPGQWNVRVYDFAADIFAHGPVVNLRVHGSAPVGDGTYYSDWTDLTIVPYGTNLNSYNKWSDATLARNSQVHYNRLMDAIGTVRANATDYSDLAGVAGRLSVSTPPVTLQPAIVKVEPYAGPMTFYGVIGPVLQFTTGSPHGLASYQECRILGYTGGDIAFSDSTSLGSHGQGLDGQYLVVWKIDATSFAAQLQVASTPPLVATTTVNSPGAGCYAQVNRGTGFPMADMIELSVIGNHKVVHISTPFTLTDAALQQLGHEWGISAVPADFEVWHEGSNETWNFGYPPNQIATVAGSVLYGQNYEDNTAATCEFTAHQWAQFRIGWVAAGRDPAMHKRMMGTNLANGGDTTRRGDYCAAHGITIDGWFGAPYLQNERAFGSPQTDFAAVIDGLTVPQTLDILEGYARDGSYEVHGSSMSHPSFPDAFSAFYEGGPDDGHLKGGGGYAATRISHGVWRSSRWKGIYELIMSRWAGAGVRGFADYAESLFDQVNPGGTGWSAFQHGNQLPYVEGDSAQDAIQDGDFDNIPLLKSTTFGALVAMKARFADASAPADFTLTLTGPATAARGATVHYFPAMTLVGSYAGTAALTTVSLPAGVTSLGFTPGSLTSSALTADLALVVGPSTPLGTATVTVRATDATNGLIHTASVSFTVTAGTAPTGRTRRLLPPLRRSR